MDCRYQFQILCCLALSYPQATIPVTREFLLESSS